MAKILLLTPQLPYPPQQGTSLRNFHIIKGLAEKHEVTLLSFVDPNQATDPETINPLINLCEKIEIVPAPTRNWKNRIWTLLTTGQPDMAARLVSPMYDSFLKDILDHQKSGASFSIIQVEGLEMAIYIKTIRDSSPDSKIVFDNHNAEAALQLSAFQTDKKYPSHWPAAFYSRTQSIRLQEYESWACRSADWVTLVSDKDRQHLESLVPGITSTTIPNSIDIGEYGLPDDYLPKKNFDILFSGKMDYRPNVDAVNWFARDVWPRILKEISNPTWAIVGQTPHNRLEWLKKMPGVTLTGKVDKIQPYLWGSKVFIMPFRMGSGTRLKLIEAMASKRAIVSTSVGSEGFNIGSNKELLIADDVESFASAVVALLANPERRRQLGEAGEEYVKQYDWRVITPLFDEVYQQLLN